MSTKEKQKKKQEEKDESGVYGEVVQIIGRTGVHGEIVQALVRILEGTEKGRIKRRNIKGNVRIGDIIILLSPETEAAEIKQA